MRKDLLTNEEFIPKRINQKFSCKEHRIKYYNDRANNLRHSTAFIDKALLKNNKILLELLKDKKEDEFHIEFLKGKGFHFGVSTHHTIYENKKYTALYDFILIPLSNDKMKIICRK